MEASETQSKAAGTGSDRVRSDSCLSWVRPAVTRISAGSAEDGAAANPDAGVNPS